ncbi:PRC-barrel domain-containing protein [Novosphingobium sp. NPDC080210]|uniref:PRC-barrel domain-containing protein n=1 Tax=Novosphingobium sp. NPDC080210 TaxID=3390596 RepID=UPI003D054990
MEEPMGQYDYTGVTGASNYSGSESGENRNGSNRDRWGSSYQSGFRGENRRNTDNAWSNDEGDEFSSNTYGTSTRRGSSGSGSSYGSGSYGSGSTSSSGSRYSNPRSGSTNDYDDDYGSSGRYSSGGYGTSSYGSSSYGTDEDYSTGTSYGRGNRYGSSTDSSSSYGRTSGSYGARSDYSDDYDNEDSETSYGRDDYRDGLAIDETRTLISSSKVEGTAVYDRDGSRMGTVHNFMVNKRSGQVDYAVLSFGGFLGMGTRYYPLPWDMLEYDTSQGGYVVDMDEDDLDEAPSFRSGEEPDFSDRYGQQVYGYYGMRY